MMKLDTPITVRELIAMVRAREDHDKPYCVYGRGDSHDASLDTVCYLSAHPEITDEFEEVYPTFVSTNELEFWYRDELVQDVVANALHQDSSATDETILIAVEHYNEHDCFLDL